MNASLRDRAAAVLAGGPGTFSKSPSRYPEGLAPTALVSGEGTYVAGDNGLTYLDPTGALGANLLGYGHPAIVQAVSNQIRQGSSFGMMHPLEVKVAELLCALIPCAEMVRWCRNGTDATNMAIRLARALTTHSHVIYAGYHGGGQDSYGITTDKPAGILPQLKPYNHQTSWGNLSGVPRHAYTNLAAIMVEVPPRPWGEPPSAVTQTLEMYRDLAHAHDALFILDEVVTFPRYGLEGAQGYYGVIPDLCCVSKALANGLPLAALCGERRLMERFNRGDIFASWTFAGETTALAAAQATLDVLRDTDALITLQEQGQRYGDGLHRLFDQYQIPATVWGNYARLQVRWLDVVDVATKEELRTFWMARHAQLCVLHGMGAIFPLTVWNDHIVGSLLTVAEDVCIELHRALGQETHPFQLYLQCPVIQDVLAVRA